jgi:hypothetical protein
MIMKVKQKDNCLRNTTYDKKKMVPTRVWGQGMEKPKVVINYNSGKEGADLSDAYLTSYCSTRSRLKKYHFKMYNRSLLGRPPKTAPPTMINAPYYMTCIAATRNEYQESLWEIKGGQRVRLTTPLPSVSWLSMKCGSLDGLLQG